ncbi:MAG: methyltransferase domain-containing protein [Nitrospina sp.]|jgi:cyclopropane fatty-acyl-phospholipid synthase-like methyltransferase|nr:methyltransferase domain-containing protein [Nitrospina sp.]
MTEENKNGYSMEDWQRHYDEGDLGWDLGQVAPPFVTLFESNLIVPGKTLVPGCGRGHEVVYLAENGFDVTAVDYSVGAVNHLKAVVEKRQLNTRILHMNFFELDPAYNEIYDLLIEQTFFCAISPEQRPMYVATVARALKKGGMLAGLFYHTGQEGGPPFNTTQDDIVKSFSDSFEIRELAQAKNSAEQRKDKEWLAILVKK